MEPIYTPERCLGCRSSSIPIECEGSPEAGILCLSGRPEKGELTIWGSQPYGELKGIFDSLGWDVASIRRGYVVRCSILLGGRPEHHEIQHCTSFLQEEFETNKPSILILLGDTACSLFPEIELSVQHGIPQFMEGDQSIVSHLEWSGYVVGMYGTTIGRRSESLKDSMIEDWVKLKEWIDNGDWQWVPGAEYEDWLAAHRGQVNTIVDDVQYSATDMYHYIRMDECERELFHQFKKSSRSVKWAVPQ